MVKRFKQNWFHILLWVFMLAYLALAPDFYNGVVLGVDKAVRFEGELPAATRRISYWIDGMNLMTVEGQDVYDLQGWAFLRDEPDQSQYERFIILQSDRGNYIFPTRSVERPDVQSAFPDLTINVQNSGFSAFISKEGLLRGTYQIGILFRHASGGEYFLVTGNALVRTANQLLVRSRNSQK